MIGEATDEDVAYVVDHGMELNIRSLKEAMAHRSGEETADSASGDAQGDGREQCGWQHCLYTERTGSADRQKTAGGDTSCDDSTGKLCVAQKGNPD